MNRDGTGPDGQGPLTGRGLGDCKFGDILISDDGKVAIQVTKGDPIPETGYRKYLGKLTFNELQEKLNIIEAIERKVKLIAQENDRKELLETRLLELIAKEESE